MKFMLDGIARRSLKNDCCKKSIVRIPLRESETINGVEEENRKAIRSCLFVSNDRLRSKTGVRARILNGSAIAKKNNGQSTTTSIKRDRRC